MNFADALLAAAAAVSALAEVSIDGSDAALARTQLRSVKRVQSQFDAHVGRLTYEADATGVFIGTGARDTAEWLGTATGTSARKNRSASELGQAMSKSQELADAVTSGEMSTDKASLVVGASGDLAVDAELLDRVADLPLNSVKPIVEAWRADHDADRDADIAATQRSRRFVQLSSERDGMTRLTGLLDPESGAIVRATLDGIMNESACDGTPRTRDQRCHDALAQLAAAAAKGELKGGRSSTKLLAIVPFETITERATARGVTHVGPTLDAATVRKLACDAGVHRVITGPASSRLDFGHEKRLVPDNLFLALVARDQRCRWPGCTIRATWCDAHHIMHWSELGPTDDVNCVLLCHRHHQLSHEPGWAVTGNSAEMVIRRPDGTTELSRPPPSWLAPRAGPTGRSASTEAARDPVQRELGAAGLDGTTTPTTLLGGSERRGGSSQRRSGRGAE